MSRKAKVRPLVRQGDVTLFPVAEPQGVVRARVIAEDRLILAEGEVSGHHHILEHPGARMVVTEAEEIFVQIMTEGAEIVHDEHGALPVMPGWYRLIQQQEQVAGEWQNVRD